MSAIIILSIVCLCFLSIIIVLLLAGKKITDKYNNAKSDLRKEKKMANDKYERAIEKVRLVEQELLESNEKLTNANAEIEKLKYKNIALSMELQKQNTSNENADTERGDVNCG